MQVTISRPTTNLDLGFLLEPVALTAELWTQERLTGFEPVTYSLEGYRSTTELQPH